MQQPIVNKVVCVWIRKQAITENNGLYVSHWGNLQAIFAELYKSLYGSSTIHWNHHVRCVKVVK